MADDTSTFQLRWPFSAAATFVGLMWIGYAWSIWVGHGIDSSARGWMMGSLSPAGYYIAGDLRPDAVLVDHEWERLVSSIFLHGGFLHIIMNSAAILQLGRILEAFTTRGRCWFTLLLSGLCGSLLTVAWAKLRGELHGPGTIGASGAGAGIGAALIVLTRGIPQLSEFRKQMVTWIVVMLAFGLVPMVSGTGHAGGALGGALAGLIIGRRGSVRLATDSWSRAIDGLTLVLTLAFVAALALTVWRAPERRASIEEIRGALNEVHGWLDAQEVPDTREWSTRLAAVRISWPYSEERDYLVYIAGWLRDRQGRTGKLPAAAVEKAREQVGKFSGL